MNRRGFVRPRLILWKPFSVGGLCKSLALRGSLLFREKLTDEITSFLNRSMTLAISLKFSLIFARKWRPALRKGFSLNQYLSILNERLFSTFAKEGPRSNLLFSKRRQFTKESRIIQIARWAQEARLLDRLWILSYQNSALVPRFS